VSEEANTDWDSVTAEVRFRSRLAAPSFSIFCAVILGVSEVGRLVGAYIILDGLRLDCAMRESPRLDGAGVQACVNP